MPIYVYKRSAGVGTEDAFWSVDKYSDFDMWELAIEHAESYGTYLDEESGDFLDSNDEPTDYAECWLEGTINTLEDLEEYSGILLYGHMQFSELKADMEKAGMVF